jgi:outer membrane protein assembly factor BamD
VGLRRAPAIGWSVAVGLAALLTGCAGKAERTPLTRPEDMYSLGLAQLEQRKLDAALRTLESIDYRLVGDDRSLEPLARLAIADATFYRGTDLDLIDARSLYVDFVTLYGDHPRAPYAQFQAGVCSLRQASHPSKDQSQTIAAFSDLRQVVRRYPESRYALAAEDMMRQAKQLLAEHEFIVGRFYLKRRRYQAASERFRGLLRQYPDYNEIERVYYNLGRSLLAEDNDVEGRLYLDKLVSDYPDSRYVRRARRLLDSIEPDPELRADGKADR